MDILILHGWNVEKERYSPIVRSLTKKGHRVIVEDMPGFGSEKVPVRPFRLSDYVAFVIQVIKGHRLKKPLVIGHSFGGRVAIVLAAKHPELVSAVVLTGVPGFLPDSTAKVSLYYALARIGGIIFSLPLLVSFKDTARKLLYRMAHATDYYRAEGIMRETFKTIIREDLESAMKKIRVPVQIIWGEDDKTTPLWIGRKIHETIRGSTLSVISGGRHCVVYDMAGEFVRKMKI